LRAEALDRFSRASQRQATAKDRFNSNRQRSKAFRFRAEALDSNVKVVPLVMLSDLTAVQSDSIKVECSLCCSRIAFI